LKTREYALLYVVQAEQPAEEQRPNVGHGRAHGVPLLTVGAPRHALRASENPIAIA
jgi:hypothetical protein